MPSAVGFGVLAAHLFCGFVVRLCSHLPRKAKNLRLPFSATGGSRLHVARLWRACLPLANYPMNTNICSLSKPVPPRGGHGGNLPRVVGGLWGRLSLHPCCNRFAVAGVPLTNHPTNANLLLIAVPVSPRGGHGGNFPRVVGGLWGSAEGA